MIVEPRKYKSRDESVGYELELARYKSSRKFGLMLNSKDIASAGPNARHYPYHRWYPMTPMLPVSLVRAYISKMKGKSLLDPFVGIGTTLVEAQRSDVAVTGVDVNSFMCLVSRVKTRHYDIDEIIAEFHPIVTNKGLAKPPQMPYSMKYYDPEILDELLRIKDGINKCHSPKIRQLMLLVFAFVAIKSANVKMTPAPRFTKNNRTVEDVVHLFTDRIKMIIEDCETSNRTFGRATVLNGDSRDLSFLDQKFDFIMTSPPYCNNLDYVRHTQLELYWTDLIGSSKDLTPIRKSSITSCEAMVYTGKDQGLHNLYVSRLAGKISNNTKRSFPQVLLQYFAGMHEHFVNVRPRLAHSGKAVYVLGDSWFMDVYIPTHKILARMCKKVGFYSVKLEFLRNRRDPYKRGLSEYLLVLSNN